MIESILLLIKTLFGFIVSIFLWIVPFLLKVIGAIFFVIMAVILGLFSLVFSIFVPEPAISSPPPTTNPAIQIEREYNPSPKQPHLPIRVPSHSSCDCPYDIAKNGSRCGGRSAYSRPNGYEPKCFLDD